MSGAAPAAIHANHLKSVAAIEGEHERWHAVSVKSKVFSGKPQNIRCVQFLTPFRGHWPGAFSKFAKFSLND